MRLFLTLEKYLANTRNWFSIDKKTITITKIGLLDFLKGYGYCIDGIKISNKDDGSILLLDLKAKCIEYNTAMCDTGIITEDTIRSLKKAIEDYLVIPDTKIEVKTDCFDNYYTARLYINFLYETKNKVYTVELKKYSQIYLKESIITDEVWYHGSDKPIKKFLFSMIGKNNGRISNYHGYGIYFIDNIERAKKYGNIITEVRIDGDSDFLVDKITPVQLFKIYEQLKSENIKTIVSDDLWYKNPKYDQYSVLNIVEEFYDYLLRRYRDEFVDIQGVSEFLLRSGIDGMKITNDVGDDILVVFNENVIDII